MIKKYTIIEIVILVLLVVLLAVREKHSREMYYAAIHWGCLQGSWEVEERLGITTDERLPIASMCWEIKANEEEINSYDWLQH